MTAATRTRLTPEQRREQLLELGLELFAGHTIEDISIDRLSEEAGVSRGLLYHYFGSKQGFHEAVIQRAADDLVAVTAPPEDDDPIVRLLASLAAYVDYVIANHAGYRSLVRAAAGGNEEVRGIYERARGQMIDRTFETPGVEVFIEDTPITRLVVGGWVAFVEDAVLAWCEDANGVSREELVRLVTQALPAIVETLD
ncbi:TetR/AcrR family transcriptional regulator [Nocardioides humilatus]|uniref:TetR/AcrR family transcriptional regulator n=1 Tax=Nocardioides humilatus TaxID=2607660 RepID=A0A5B1LFL2_9ACTN|nr:TetR/AcrR family transcriptional regulator [Nocardioides humilatus]KAA1419124.1 TetR/AcrR family transcriptional regulator [Nocardioides humilatus]